MQREEPRQLNGLTRYLKMEKRDRIIRSLVCPYIIDDKTLTVGASCGYAIYPLESEDTSKIRILADQRMYAEKEQNHQKTESPVR